MQKYHLVAGPPRLAAGLRLPALAGLLACGGVGLFSLAPSYAGLPEPSAVLWGAVFVAAEVQQASDEVIVRARLNRTPAETFPGPEDWIVGQYKLGASVAASTQTCNDGDCYLLSIQLESVPSSMSRTPGRASLGDEVRICVSRGNEPEVCSDRDRITIQGRAYSARRNVGLAPATFDWNIDGLIGPLDHDQLSQCFLGPGIEAAPRCQEVFDVVNDGAVGLRSFAGFQNAFDPN